MIVDYFNFIIVKFVGDGGLISLVKSEVLVFDWNIDNSYFVLRKCSSHSLTLIYLFRTLSLQPKFSMLKLINFTLTDISAICNLTLCSNAINLRSFRLIKINAFIYVLFKLTALFRLWFIIRTFFVWLGFKWYLSRISAWCLLTAFTNTNNNFLGTWRRIGSIV